MSVNGRIFHTKNKCNKKPFYRKEYIIHITHMSKEMNVARAILVQRVNVLDFYHNKLKHSMHRNAIVFPSVENQRKVELCKHL